MLWPKGSMLDPVKTELKMANRYRYSEAFLCADF